MSAHPKLDVPLADGNTTTAVGEIVQGVPRRSLHKHPFTRLRQWIAAELVADVPQSDAVCEFDCRRTQCSAGAWEVCDRRRSNANGELWPAREPSRRHVPEKALG
jgi:hypothetical protein